MTCPIRKVVIPVAGAGSRLMPMTHVLPKALFPVVLGSTGVKAVLHVLLEQVCNAGIDEVVLVVSAGQRRLIEAYLDGVSPPERGTLPRRLMYVEQDGPRGFGDAVLQSRRFIRDQPFAILLGDHITVPDAGAEPCLTQVLHAFDQMAGKAMIGVHEVAADGVSEVGVAAGRHVVDNIYRCFDFVEKPDPAVAQERLVTEGLPVGRFLGHCGVYLFTPDIFGFIEQAGRAAEKRGGEVELAAGQHRLLDEHPGEYFLCRIQGRAYDMGTPKGYLRTLVALGQEGTL